jgi:hypothetical protein
VYFVLSKNAIDARTECRLPRIAKIVRWPFPPKPFSPRAGSEASPQTAEKDLDPIDRVVKVERLRLPRDSGEASDLGRCAAVWEKTMLGPE